MNKPEITWSLMHPTELNVEYMKKIAAAADKYRVDSFEICAACHTLLGGLDGLVLYEDYPAVAASIDRDGILKNRERLKTILDIAHAGGRPVYYWHREVTVWPEFLHQVPELMDKNGEFDLLGEAFENLLRYKLAKAFEAVPELDGIVLTLTEADFSAIHNSTPDVYPPEQVVNRIVRIFAEEHEKRNKRFILRSFGSIAKDYEDILAGAALAAPDHAFEVETKITPYDFVPFLPDNTFFCQIPNLTAGAECDSLGEFLSSGYLPAENVEHIVRYVRHARKCGVSRYAIRMDRVGNSVFECCPINLYAYARAIDDPGVTPEQIREEYAAAHYPESCRKELLELGRSSFDLVAKAHYINRNLIFHGSPAKGEIKWLKAGGYFSLFAENKPLNNLEGIWSIQYKESTLQHAALLEEKAQAVEIARRGVEVVKKYGSQLDAPERSMLTRLWNNALEGSQALLKMAAATVDYVEMMNRHADPAEYEKAVMARGIENSVKSVENTFVNGEEHGVFPLSKVPFEDVYVKGINQFCRNFIEEYQAEYRLRERFAGRKDIVDMILPGTICDDWRCERNMHAAHGAVVDGIPVRYVGNTVFPNGFLKFELDGEAKNISFLGAGWMKAEIDGRSYDLELMENTPLNIPVSGSKHIIKLTKSGREYPCIAAVLLLA